MAYNVVITEDDQVTALFLKKITEQIGHTVIGTARTGEQAIQLVENNKVDVVLMDISLAGEDDGISTTHTIMESHNIPVIYITGTNSRNVMDRALESHPYGYIPKPINQEILQTMIILGIQRHGLEENLKNSQQQLKELNSELEKKVAARTQDLATTNAHLEQEVDRRKQSEEQLKIALAKERELNELKSRIVNIISHEIKTPLTGVKSSADLIQMHAENQSPIEKITKHTQSIHKSVDNLTHIVNETLQVGQLEDDIFKPQLQEEDIADLFLHKVEQVAMGVGNTHQINQDHSLHHPKVVTDKRLFNHIVTNLLTNAVKYSKPQSIIEAHLTTSSSTLTLHVKDHGIGIPEKDQKLLFQMFHRAANVTNIEGVGIGLAIVKKCVEQLKGQITFESEIDKGTIFTITLPLT